MPRMAVKITNRFCSSLASAYSPAVWLLTGGLYYRWTFAAERFIRQGPVLDVGCGAGRLLARLAGQGIEVIGVDKSPQMVQAAQRYLHRKQETGIVICADARRLPLPDESIGTIINTFATSYVKEEQTWKEYVRVLRPGGRWIVADGPLLQGFNARLIGYYLYLLVGFGWSLGRKIEPTTIPTRLFPRQWRELVPVGPTQARVHIFEKA